MRRLWCLVKDTLKHRSRIPNQYFLLFGGNSFTGYLDVYVRHGCLLFFVATRVFSDDHDNLALLLIGFHVSVGIGNGLQRECGINDRA